MPKFVTKNYIIPLEFFLGKCYNVTKYRGTSLQIVFLVCEVYLGKVRFKSIFSIKTHRFQSICTYFLTAAALPCSLTKNEYASNG